MIRQHPFLLGLLATTWIIMVLACGGTGNQNGGDAADRTVGPGAANKQPGKSAVAKKEDLDRKEKAAWKEVKARAEAEAEADARNKANLQAYDDATRAYTAARVEYLAAWRLKQARELSDRGEAALRRFREVIDTYPGTQTAKDAQVLLTGGQVPRREMPPTPCPPVKPEPVVAVYPPSPEEKRRRAREATLAAQEADDMAIVEEAARHITKEKYDQVKTGMTGDQVYAIVGVPGEELSRVELDGITTICISWQNKGLLDLGSNRLLTFQNGRVVTKSQFGLMPESHEVQEARARLQQAKREREREEGKAKAEAEADAQNKANRQAWAEEVMRRRAEYKLDKEAYDAAMRAYPAAKAEYDAARKFEQARALRERARSLDVGPVEVEEFREAARRQYGEIIEAYPHTQAAKDADVLLNLGKVPRREPPLEPARPVKPELILPKEPEPVVAVYQPTKRTAARRGGSETRSRMK